MYGTVQGQAGGQSYLAMPPGYQGRGHHHITTVFCRDLAVDFVSMYGVHVPGSTGGSVIGHLLGAGQKSKRKKKVVRMAAQAEGYP